MRHARATLKLTLALALLSPALGLAQIKPPVSAKRAMADPTMVIEDRGAKLEVLATERATRTLDAQGRRLIHRVRHAATAAPLNSHELGVVFNHTMQQQGYTTGEIAFVMRSGSPAPKAGADYPGLRKLTATGLYVVRATTPAQFVSLTKQLQKDTRIAWVEPIVIYGPTARPSGQ